MNADPAAQLRLLDLQAADTALAQLAHRRASLPELAALADADRRADEVHADVVDLRTRLDDIADDQRRMENDVDAVRTRAKRDEERLASGGVPAKELEGLQHEVATLARRQSSLEDDLLEVMEQREGVEGELGERIAIEDAIASERADLIARRDAAFGEIDAAAAKRTTERATVAGEIPADLLALYDKVRASSGGVGAAMLRQRRCEGCRIELAGNELGSVRGASPETVVRCENCRRILVRTGESGL